MSTRLSQRFAQLAQEKRAGLITFLMGGDPSIETSQTILNALPAAGADIIEIGMPFSDPMADGPVIEEAGLRALKAGANLKKILGMVKTFRAKDSDTPIILMGYYNPVYRYGPDNFARDASAAGIDGVILVDLPPEEEDELAPNLKQFGIAFIRLATPTSDDQRLPKLLQSAEGFIYYVSVAGITGGQTADMSALKTRVMHLKTKTKLPIAIGFGIKSPDQVKAVAAFADAVVVGSALVSVIKKTPTPEAACAFVRTLSTRS